MRGLMNLEFINNPDDPVLVGSLCYERDGYVSSSGEKLCGMVLEINDNKVLIRPIETEKSAEEPRGWRLPELPPQHEEDSDIILAKPNPVLEAYIKATHYMQVYNVSICKVDLGVEINETVLAELNTDYELELIESRYLVVKK